MNFAEVRCKVQEWCKNPPWDVPDLDQQQIGIDCDAGLLTLENGGDVPLEDLGNRTIYRLAPNANPGVNDREWHDTAPAIPISASTTAAGRAFRLGHDFSLPVTTQSVNPDITLNDTDNTGGELDVQVVDTIITVPAGGVWIQYSGGSEGYWAIEVGFCCGPLQLIDELGHSDRENAQAIVGPVFLPEGQHNWRGWNIDSGGTNSSHADQYSLDGVAFGNAVPAGVEFSLEHRAQECMVIPACDAVPDGWSDCPLPECGAPAVDPPLIEDVPRQIETTCAALAALGNAGGLEVGCEYVVTDYNRGTVGAARILTHAVSANEVSWNVSVDTTFDDSAWMGRWDPDTCRIVDLFDNLGNKIRSDNGDEIDVFPWGNALVTGNTFTDTDFNYGGGTVRDNVGSPTARLDTSGTAQVEQNELASLADVRVNDARMVRTNVSSRGRVRLDGTARLDDSSVSDYSYVDYDALQVYYSSFESQSYLYGDGAVGRIDNADFSRGYADLRGAADVNIDDLTLDAYGRLLANGADVVRILRTNVSSSAYIQVTAGNSINASETTVESASLVRVLNGELRVDNTTVTSSSRLDQNTPGLNTVIGGTAQSAGIIEFINTAVDNRIEYSTASNQGALRFRGTSTGGIIRRTQANSGHVQIQDSNNVRVWYVSVDAIGYVIIREQSDGFQVQYSTFTGYGRMLVEDQSTGRVLGVQLTSTAYVRLRTHASDFRYSEINSYAYLYIDNNTAVKQGLHFSGRQTYTEPNPGATVTGAGVRNW